MKKRIIIASTLLFLAIGMCVFSFMVTKLISENMLFSIDNIEEAIILNDIDTALEETERLSDVWQTYYNILSLYIRHDLVENTDAYISSISKYLMIDEQSAALLICQDMRISVEQILENEKFNLSNIL